MSIEHLTEEISRIASELSRPVTASGGPRLSDNVAYSSYLKGMQQDLIYDTVLYFIRDLSKGTPFQGKAGALNIWMDRREPEGAGTIARRDTGVKVHAEFTFTSKGIKVKGVATREWEDDDGFSEEETLATLKRMYSLDSKPSKVGNEVGHYFNKYLRG